MTYLPFPYFNPRPPRGGRRCKSRKGREEQPGFQSTPPARGATAALGLAGTYAYISIHAPREGGDLPRPGDGTRNRPISIHAPREGGDRKDAQFYLRIFDK